MSIPAIESKPSPQDSLGPRDLPVPDPYNIERLEARLGELGFRLAYSAETLTTMAVVRDEALAGRTSPLVALTDHQTQGVGRDLTKRWHDIKGASILFSAFFEIDKTTTAEFADIVALQLCMALREQDADVAIKAPNDIVSSETGEKVSGVLVQAIYDQSARYIGTNVGIGVNVHYAKPQLDRYPTDYGATSLDLITGKQTSRQEALIAILEAISTAEPEARVIDHTPSVRKRLDDLWAVHSFLLGKDVSVLDGDSIIQGEVVKTRIGQGIVIKTPDGKEHTVSLFGSNTKVRLDN